MPENDNSLWPPMRHLQWMNSEYEPGLVSVIVPTYNRARYLGEAMDSVWIQTYRPIELIVIDDGSTDSTEERVTAFGEKCEWDPAFALRYIRQDNQGAPAARNRGLTESRGEHIQFLDSDDLLANDKISAQVEALSNATWADVAYASWRCIYGKQRLKYGPRCRVASATSEDRVLGDYFSGRQFLPSHSVLFRRDVVARIGPWDERLLQRQDTDYLTRALMMRCRLIHVPGAEVFYRRHNSDHIGHAARSIDNFSSLLLLFKKWHATLTGMGDMDRYRADLLRGVVQLAEHAVIAGIPDGLKQCEDLAYELFGSSSAVHDSLTIRRYVVLYAKRLIGNPWRALFGEYHLMLAKQALRGAAAVLRSFGSGVRGKKGERSSLPRTPHEEEC